MKQLGVLCIFLLVGCVSSNNEETSYSIQGKVNIAIATVVDSDINDINAAYRSNDDPEKPQPIGNLVAVQGYISATGSHGDEKQQRFARQGDVQDYYRTRLKKGQIITVKLAGLSNNSRASVSLIKLNNGRPDSTLPPIVAGSIDNTRGAFIKAPVESEYLILIEALASQARYILRIQPARASAQNRATQATDVKTVIEAYGTMDFIPGQIVMETSQSNDQRRTIQTLSDGLEVVSQSHTALSKPLNSVPADIGNSVKKGPLLLTMHAAMARSSDKLNRLAPMVYQKIQTLKKIAELNRIDGVSYAEPNYIRTASLVPNDAYFSQQWNMQQINAPLVWDITRGNTASGRDVIVAVVDSGVYLQHPELKGQLVSGYDFISDPALSLDGDGIDPDPGDPGDPSRPGTHVFHGTHVAGIIAAASNNKIGMAGVAWNARIMPLRALGRGGAGTSYDLIQSLRYAAGMSNDSGRTPDQRADIINLSLGNPGQSRAEQEVLKQIYDDGIIVVAAAGNTSSQVPQYPASYNGVISVSATNLVEQKAYYSSYGEQIDIAAPGGSSRRDDNHDGEIDGILSLWAINSSTGIKARLFYQEGTSMAAPHVSGVMALMKAIYPLLTAQQAKRLLESGLLSRDIGIQGKDREFGYGLIDALSAVKEAQKLANNGELPPQPVQLVIEPKILLAVNEKNSLSFTLENKGGQDPTVTLSQSQGSEKWLTFKPDPDVKNGLGKYTVTIDKSNLPDGTYKASIRALADTGASAYAEIFTSVGAVSIAGELTRHYVNLVSSDNGKVLSTVAADSTGRFEISNVTPGKYYLVAGSDIDTDHILCLEAETCGIHPKPGEPLIEIGEADIKNIQIPVNIQSASQNSRSATGVNRKLPTYSGGNKTENPRKLFGSVSVN